ncbi:DC-STAMP domain-containing protein 2-like isoform X2 [Ruditapes philippinarum]|uniref:DC-STAMP domain-containing protein 2-like isoform X2 n=1 Tax=Ruditapes philippinarum TaxID=129788 RepID=UPI00295AB0E7|nr:DC-STAMP domain-containing protein 2-like isoform X2 [Ruditapes philippinarum]
MGFWFDLAERIQEAIRIKQLLSRLSRAKENALRELMGLPPKTSWWDECTTNIMTFFRDKICQTMFPCCIYDVNRRKKRPSCWTSPTFREFLGFLGGIILTMISYLMMVYQMEMPPVAAFPLCAIGGLAITLTMAFSSNIRCLVLLMLPQFFSSKGRMLLLTYAMILAMSHPLNNVKVNIGVMAQSATCGQEKALNETKALVKSAVAPMQSIMDSIKDVLSKLVDFSNMMKKTYSTLRQTVMEIGSTIKRVGRWLASIVDRCNDKMGAPYKKCKKVFEDAVNDCKSKLSFLGGVCDIADGFGILCNIVRVGELLCHVVKFIKDLIENAVDLPTQKILSSAKEMFYFNVSIKYSFNYTMTQSKKYSQIKEDISKDIMSYLDNIILIVRVFRNAMVITATFILIKALIYRSKWLSNDRYDNIYITFTVRDLDERRYQKSKPGIMPLNFDERNKYVESVPAHTKLHVAGTGPMADMYRSVVGMFDPISDTSKSKTDVTPCVPHPSEPDWDLYRLIAFIYFACLILTITEAYGLRLRHLIMGCYFPQRERKRAIWLFNHILKTRGGILANARDNMKKNKKGGVYAKHISLKGRLAASFPIVEKILKCFGWEVKSCLYCGKEGKPADYVNFVHCSFFDCDAVYCIACYADLENICAVCENAVEMKGSDGSEEEDSSKDEYQDLKNKTQKLVRQKKIEKAERERAERRENMRAQFLNFGSKEDLEGIQSNLNLNCTSAVEIWTHLRKRRNKGRSESIYLGRNNNNKNNNTNVDCEAAKTITRQTARDRTAESCRPVKGLQLSDKKVGRNLSKRNCSDSSKKWKGLFYTTDESDEEISSGSSIDTEDLDFDYQYRESSLYSTLGNKNDLFEYETVRKRRRRRKLDLVSDDIFSDTSSESEHESVDSSSPEANFLEPISVYISRE